MNRYFDDNIVAEIKQFDLAKNIITKDNFMVELKGYYSPVEYSLDKIEKSLQSYFKINDFMDTLSLIENENLNDKFPDLSLAELKLTTINAIQQPELEEKYAINPDLEGKGEKKKGFFSRFRKK